VVAVHAMNQSSIMPLLTLELKIKDPILTLLACSQRCCVGACLFIRARRDGRVFGIIYIEKNARASSFVF